MLNVQFQHIVDFSTILVYFLDYLRLISQIKAKLFLFLNHSVPLLGFLGIFRKNIVSIFITICEGVLNIIVLFNLLLHPLAFVGW